MATESSFCLFCKMKQDLPCLVLLQRSRKGRLIPYGHCKVASLTTAVLCATWVRYGCHSGEVATSRSRSG